MLFLFVKFIFLVEEIDGGEVKTPISMMAVIRQVLFDKMIKVNHNIYKPRSAGWLTADVIQMMGETKSQHYQKY